MKHRYRVQAAVIRAGMVPTVCQHDLDILSIELSAMVFPTVENAYQASKVQDPSVRFHLGTLTPGQSKRYLRQYKGPLAWHPHEDLRKLGIMEGLLRQKFQIPDLRQRLLATAPRRLLEWNTWGDVFWGVVSPKDQPEKWEGANHLGRLLMQIRTEAAQ